MAGVSGGAGSGPIGLKFPTSIYIYGGYLYVADKHNHRIQRFTLDATSPPVVPFTAIASSSPTCQSVASATATVTDGTAPYSYTWVAPAGVSLSGGSTSVVQAGVGAGVSGVLTLTALVRDAASQTATLTASGATTYRWQTPSTSVLTNSFQASVSGVYTVTGTTGVCSATARSILNVVAPPSLVFPGSIGRVGPGNCSISIPLTNLKGQRFIITGPNFRFIRTYRFTVSVPIMIVSGITSPGRYTLVMSSVGSSQTRTFTVDGVACPSPAPQAVNLLTTRSARLAGGGACHVPHSQQQYVHLRAVGDGSGYGRFIGYGLQPGPL